MTARLIVALDVPDRAAARRAVERLDGTVDFFKVGLELFTAEGPAVVRDLTGRGIDVFLDLKLHDIPNTVAGAVRSAVGLGARLVTLHALGGAAMLQAAADAAGDAAARAGVRRPALVAVTLLTSHTEEAETRATVTRLGTTARDAGLDGVVCAPAECAAIKRSFGPAFRVVTPGIRPAGAEAGDQRRTATPAEAVRAGSDFLVIGRPILKAPDPAAAAAAVFQEMEKAAQSQRDDK